MRIRASLIAAVFVLCAPPAFAAPTDSDGWQSPDTLAGLVGSYTRPPLGRGSIAFVTLGGSDGYRAEGPYTRFVDVGRGQLAVQSGRYAAIANNPAVGAFMLFNDDAGSFRDAYPIVGIKRDPLGIKIIALELIDFRDGSLFALTRVGL
jgi:hypothetical protein